MEVHWSIEDVARMSDDGAARRRFDQRNYIWLVLLASFFGFVAIIELANRRPTVTQVLIAGANCIFILGALFLLRRVHRATRADAKPSMAANWIAHHISATSIAFVAVQYSLVLAFNRSDASEWFSWAIVFAFLMVGFRMVVAELALLHVIIITGALTMMFVAPPKVTRRSPPFYVIIAVTNGVAFGIELFASTRLRRSVVNEFGERRKQAREQIRMRDELRYARELQLSMLPECAPTLSWADVCAISMPATEVGGDYYDYFVDGDRVAIVCGDVAGHGMASWLVLSALRSGFMLLRDTLGDPAGALVRLHDLVAQTSRRRLLVTVSVLLLDHSKGKATIASAGHPPILLRRVDGSVETIELFAPPLGVRLPINIPQRTFDIAPGDTFVLHSDGIYEARNAAGEEYGIERLAELVRTHAGTSSESLRDAITTDVAAFRGAGEQDDDVTVVIARLL